MKKEIFYGRNIDGVPTIPRSKALKEAMAAFGDTPWQITLDRKIKKRSLSQNAYYRGAVIPSVIDALVDNGYPRSELSNEVVHELLKGKFLQKEVVSDQGEILKVTKSTTELSTVEFLTYIDDIVRWCASVLSYVIPEPNSQSTLNFGEEE